MPTSSCSAACCRAATTDASGRAELGVVGESPDTIRALYVKPKVDFSDLLDPTPSLMPDGVNTVGVKPLSFLHRRFPRPPAARLGPARHGARPGADQPRRRRHQGRDRRLGAQPRSLIATFTRSARASTWSATTNAGWTNDVVGHGSHCAGIIAGRPVRLRHPRLRTAAEIHVLRIFPGARFSDLIGALRLLHRERHRHGQHGLGGGEPSQIVEDRLIKAKSMGMACIIAAGNWGGPVQSRPRPCMPSPLRDRQVG